MPSSRVLVEEILRALEERGESFAVAESCTAGKLSAAFSYRDGLSKYYVGGVCSYSNFAKEVLLGVRKSSLNTYGAVSKEVAKEMAVGLKERLQADWSLSVTGTAGPSGGTTDKPVGTVCFALLGPNFEETYKQVFSGTRESVQEQSIDFILRTFIKNLKTA